DKAYLRYDGSHQALEVPFGDVAMMQAAFEAAHQQRFGFTSPERAILFEMVSAEAIGETGEAPQSLAVAGGTSDPVATVPFYSDGAPRTAPLYGRENLEPSARVTGPAIITESTGTNVIEAGWVARVDPLGNLVLERMEKKARALAAGTTADPVLLEVFNNLFMSVADQMGATLANTSWSVNIKERLDFSCAIFDDKGDLVANAPHVPVHLGSMSDSIKTVMRENAGDIHQGDAFMLNSPYNGGTHLPDVTVVTPVFVGGQVVFWLGSRGHHADIGGRTPGSAPPDSTHIEDEGVLIDNVRLVDRGVLQDTWAEAILASGKYPCRNIAQNMADLKAQVAANETGRRALLGVVDHFSLDVVQAYMGHVQDNAEESVRQVIGRLKDGEFTYPMDSGAVIKVQVTVDAAAREAVIDFTGTTAQDAGNYNAPFAVCSAVVLYVFRTMVGADIPLNQG
ncbi:MAG: hydantoinase B/oxoprolinase family protein, partial [Marinosulfonomonas sp.]|nr:hydantoinase B/oxoprolinase family protein [Marinosulfonomonas sp.]